MTQLHLNNHPQFTRPRGPVVEVIMDGVGYAPAGPGNAVAAAYTPFLDWLLESVPWILIKAHGPAVGLPSDKDMGNSEVGHNALGAGRVFDQGAKLVSRAIETGRLFEGPVWRQLIARVAGGRGTLHFIGLLSDGNVHSHIDHLLAMLDRASTENVRRVRVHILLDGRDVGERSALKYVDILEKKLSEINELHDRDYRIASGGGRMVVTMDRYEADWRIVERGWNAHVHGRAERTFASAAEAIRTFYDEDPRVIDQFLPPFVIVDGDGRPVGPMEDGDSVIFFNFRGDRAIEISRAFEEDDFPYFDRGRRPDVMYAGMMEYDGDLHIPRNYLVAPPEIDRTMSEYLVSMGIRQFAIAETQKFGHVTYFWNGNRSGKFSEELESYVEIPSDRVPFQERPWMKASEVADELLSAIRSGSYDFLRVNFANGDMVGHTGDFRAALIAVEAVDLNLARIKRAVEETGGVLVVTADHGNADEMFMLDKQGNPVLSEEGSPKPKTSHTLSPVIYAVYDPAGKFRVDPGIKDGGLGNNAATIMELLGFEPPEDYMPSLLARP